MKQLSKWYRPDIDGLRAVAVLAVVFYHLDLLPLPGGYLGVDIFFVISGYLITSIILRELKNGTFSLANFWARRIRRILPALSVVLATSAIVAYWLSLLPSDFASFGKSLFAQSIFLSNFFFMRNDNYFADSADSMPLLHTWSLSVEEQFYLIFPILLIFLYKIGKRHIATALGLIALASFILNIYLSVVNPDQIFSLINPSFWGEARNFDISFYLLPARAWELLVGALAALATFKISGLSARFLSILGLVSIMTGLIIGDASLGVPGWVALLPVLGTVAIILANKEHVTLVAKLLSYGPLVWIGLISYSLYLWHWPVYVFAKHYFLIEVLTVTQKVSLLLTSVGLAYITYELVEVPFIKKKDWSLFKTYAFGISLITLSIVISILIFKSYIANPTKTESALLITESINSYGGERLSRCVTDVFKTESEPCLLGAKDSTNISVMLWGDSHAVSILPALDTYLEEQGVTGIAFVSHGCLPLIDVVNIKNSNQCTQVKSAALHFIENQQPKNILLIARWQNYKDSLTVSKSNSAEVTLKSLLTSTINFASSSSVFILQQVPFQSEYDEEKQYSFYNRNDLPLTLNSVAVSKAEHLLKQSVERAIIGEASTASNATLIDPTELLCDDLFCSIQSGTDKILYRDASHLSTDGASFIIPLLKPLTN